MNENKEKDFVTSDNANSSDIGDAPVDSRTTDEQKAKVLLVGAGDYGLISKAIFQHLAERNIDVIDTIGDMSKPLSYVDPKLPELPFKDLSIYGDVQKKKKPCTYHEYTEHRQKAGDNYIISKWTCRHCGKEL